MDLITWARGFFKEAIAPEKPPLEQTQYLRIIVQQLDKFDHSQVLMTREMPDRFPDIYHLIAMVTDSIQNIKVHATLPNGVRGSINQSKTVSDYITDHEGRAAERDQCFLRLGEETAKLLDALDRVKKANDIEHRHYMMGLEVLLLEIGLVFETYMTPK